MQTSSDRPVAVVGAGGSGLHAAAALRRAGVRFEVLDGRDGIGGTWRYDEAGNGSACYASLVANTSKLRMAFGGRPIAGRPWQYASHDEMLEHLESFTDEEDLRAHIRLGWHVGEARPEDGGWTLMTERGDARRYRRVVCAIPANGRPRLADLPGNFTGEQLHSSAYRKPDRFAGKRVLVLGLGTSGAEVAGEVAAVARSVEVSVRSPLWMMTPRIGGIPADWLDNRRVGRVETVVAWARSGRRGGCGEGMSAGRSQRGCVGRCRGSVAGSQVCSDTARRRSSVVTN
jgi:cation diffusion facilitator CzcD-associated flavoprotein CzcO